ncbi:MAG: DUF2782 domain-containing protein [Sideroxydans sp.]|nr:DUF2782 domain-containing protein [Sideroxydans sp.]
MRLKLFLLLATLSAGSYAATMAQDVPPPPPLDAAADAKDAPPAKPAGNGASAEEPQVTITRETGRTVEEYRVGGKLYMIKITPKIGKPYYLVDDRGDGKFVRQDSLDNGFRVPRWIIHQF